MVRHSIGMVLGAGAFERGIPSSCLRLFASGGMEYRMALGAIRRSLTARTLPGGKLAFTFPYSPKAPDRRERPQPPANAAPARLGLDLRTDRAGAPRETRSRSPPCTSEITDGRSRPSPDYVSWMQN